MNTPVIFTTADDSKLQELRTQEPTLRELDIYPDCLEEYFEITHPTIKPGQPQFTTEHDQFMEAWQHKPVSEREEAWIYYPWIKTLVHAPAPSMYKALRSSRNRNLVTEKEQAILSTKRIGIGGMSVGSNILNTMVLTSLGGSFKVADPDVISLPNLNRLAAPMHAVGMNKATYFAQRAWEVDPYLEIETYINGIGEGDIEPFLNDPKVDLMVEEMDSPKIKIDIRKRARELGIPVVMAADNGDGILIDVERYDLDPTTDLFNGRLGHINLDTVGDSMSFPEKLALIASMAGLSEATVRMQSSILDVGKTLNTWPQLGTAAVVAGVAITFIARRIFLGEEMPSGRYRLGMEEHFVPNFLSPEAIAEREAHTQQIMETFERIYQQPPQA
jgi:hypothetical protein